MVREDRSYLSHYDKIALERNIARLGIFHIAISKAHDENAPPVNYREMYGDEWQKHIAKDRKETSRKIEGLLLHLAKEFKIFQFDKKEDIPYGSDWDLFFWCNWTDGERDYTYVTLGGNKKRTLEAQLETFDRLFRSIDQYGSGDFDIRVQRNAVYEGNQIEEMAKEKYQKLKGTIITNGSRQGKIREIKGEKGSYGFFLKWSKTKYYPVSTLWLALLEI